MAEFYRITTEWTGPPGTPWYSTHVAVKNFSADAGDYGALVVAFWEVLDGQMFNAIDGRVLETVDVFESDTGATVGVESWDGADISPSSADNPLPYATQGLLQLRTGVYVGGREIRGRMFLPGFTEDNNTTGVPNSALMGVMSSAGALLENQGFYVYSPTQNVCEQITSATPWNKWAVLRSRRD